MVMRAGALHVTKIHDSTVDGNIRYCVRGDVEVPRGRAVQHVLDADSSDGDIVETHSGDSCAVIALDHIWETVRQCATLLAGRNTVASIALGAGAGCGGCSEVHIRECDIWPEELLIAVWELLDLEGVESREGILDLVIGHSEIVNIGEERRGLVWCSSVAEHSTTNPPIVLGASIDRVAV